MSDTSPDPDPRDPRYCLGFAVRSASRRVSSAYDETLRPTGLRSTQFTLLALLARSGATSVGRLAELLGTDRTTLTRNLAVLEERGLVSVAPGDDRRTRIVQATAEGQDAVESALPAWHKAQTALIDGMEGDLPAVLATLANLGDTAARDTR